MHQCHCFSLRRDIQRALKLHPRDELSCWHCPETSVMIMMLSVKPGGNNKLPVLQTGPEWSSLAGKIRREDSIEKAGQNIKRAPNQIKQSCLCKRVLREEGWPKWKTELKLWGRRLTYFATLKENSAFLYSHRDSWLLLIYSFMHPSPSLTSALWFNSLCMFECFSLFLGICEFEASIHDQQQPVFKSS